MKRISISDRPLNIVKNLILLFCCALSSLYGLVQIICNDIWLHLKTGAWIWSHHTVPSTQLYSFLLGSKEWIDHSWLFQLIIYPIYSLAGLNGLIFFRFFIISIILGIFFTLAKNTHRYFLFSALTILLSATVAYPRFFIRPEIFSLLFTVSFIFLLKSYRGRNSIFLLLPLQIFWVNSHGYYIIGPILVCLFILAKIIEAKVKLPFSWNENRLNNYSLRKLIYLLSLMIIAALINPYFLKGALYPFKVLGSIALNPLEGRFPFSFISELGSTPVFNIIYGDKLSLLSTAIIIFFFSMLVNVKKADIFDLMVFFAFLGLTIKAYRHIGLFALSSGVLTLFNLNLAEYNPVFSERQGRWLFKIIFQKIVPALLLVILAINLFFKIGDFFQIAKAKYIYDLKGRAKGFLLGRDESSLSYPIGAARFIKENQIKGNIFNIFNHGAYLIFSLYPDCKVFIDGRTELYGDTLLKAAETILLKPQILDKIKENLSIECVVLPCSDNSRFITIFNYMYKNKDWKLVFFDGRSSVFLEDSYKFSSLIKNKQVVLEGFRFEPDRRLIEIARKRRFYPLSFINIARFFYRMDMPQLALEAIEIAQGVRPGDFENHNLKAVLLDKLGRSEEALNEFFKTAEIEPTNPLIYKNLGVFFLKRGRLEIAREYFKEGLKISPGDEEFKRYLQEINEYIKERAYPINLKNESKEN